MAIHTSLEEFGSATSCASLTDVESLIRKNAGVPKVRMQAATFGLALVASQAIGETKYLEDARHVLDEMAKAKASIDIAAWHDIELARATASIMLAAQQYLDEQTIPCAEWPTPEEVAGVALEAARKHASA